MLCVCPVIGSKKLSGVSSGVPFGPRLLYGAPAGTGKLPICPTIRLFGLQIAPWTLWFGLPGNRGGPLGLLGSAMGGVGADPTAVLSSGLSQLMVKVFPKSPD